MSHHDCHDPDCMEDRPTRCDCGSDDIAVSGSYECWCVKCWPDEQRRRARRKADAAICNCGHTLLGHVLDGYCLAGHGCECPAYVPKSDTAAATRRMSDEEFERLDVCLLVREGFSPVPWDRAMIDAQTSMHIDHRRAREAEARLRKAIEDADHGHGCAKIIYWERRRGSDAAEHIRIYNATPCNCWKGKALAP